MVSIFSSGAFAQAKKPKPKSRPIVKLPKVTQIDAEKLKALLKPNGKPLLVNFWATWCDPCREEFPDLVKIAADYKDKINLITVSLDDLAQIKNDVPKFLAQMKSDSPAYLLKVPDEGAAIALVAKDWQGGLPFTILFNTNGETVYFKQGKFQTDLLRAEIEKNLTAQSQTTNPQILELPKSSIDSDLNYEKGKADASQDVAKGKLIIKRYGLTPSVAPESLKTLKEKYGVEFYEYGCLVTTHLIEYVLGYNEISKAELKRKFGDKVADIIAEK